ncbi:recombinase family protein [Paenibacillus sp. MBLB4367]|uniref:recombinase family protein n=1 Tax=Paenibacillus sp. MBLB4367 TaxID=3384767 RepID=UPI0039081A20
MKFSIALELLARFKDYATGAFNSHRPIDLLKIFEELGQHRITFRSLSENFETETAMGMFTLQMLGAVGDLE